MKRVINGHRYDTSTAKKIGTDSYSNGSDFDYWEETLYKNKAGLYFLYGEGGPRSRYAETVGQNEWAGGEKIMPISENAAKEWGEDVLDADVWEATFGAVDTDMVQISATIPLELKEKMEAEKAKRGETTAELIIRVLK